MAQTTVLPDRPEAVTAEWLTKALASSFPGTQVTRVDVLDQHSGTTGRMRIRLDYAAGGPRGPESAFVKLPPFDADQREMNAMADMGRRETRFYEGPGKETPMRVPKSYYAAHGEEPTQYIMIIEDLEASGCTFAKDLDAHAEANAEQLINSLALHHAHFWNDPRFDDEWSWLTGPMRSTRSSDIVADAKQQFADQFPPVFGDLADLWIHRREEITDLWNDGAKTLIHGDTHNGNHFMDGTTVGLYDWAVISKAPSIRDIAIYLGHSVPTAVRRREQDRWLRGYHQILVDAGVNPPSFDELWLRFRRGVLYAWVSAVTTAAFGDRMQPIAVSRKAMTLATATCADLDTVGALREAL